MQKSCGVDPDSCSTDTNVLSSGYSDRGVNFITDLLLVPKIRKMSYTSIHRINLPYLCT